MLKGKIDPQKQERIKVLDLNQNQIININDYIRLSLNKAMTKEMVLNKINERFNLNINMYALNKIMSMFNINKKQITHV